MNTIATRLQQIALGITVAGLSLSALGGPPPKQTPVPSFRIGLNFAADEYPDSGGILTGAGRLAPTDIAGVPGVAQGNWNNLETLAGSVNFLTGDNQGVAVDTSASVSWNCNNTWSSTGRGEENNGFPAGSPDYKLMIGYLDSGDPTTTTVSITGLPGELTEGYDVYVYMLGGVGDIRGGGYRIRDLDTGNTLRDYLVGDAPVNPSTFVRDVGLSHDDKGNYLLFRSLTAPNIIIEATTEQPYGMVRAPLNAVQIVAAALDTTPPSEPTNLGTVLVGGSFVNLKWDASTDDSSTLWYELMRDGVVVARLMQTNYSDTGLSLQTIYTYQVRAIDDAGNQSPFSMPLIVTTVGEVEAVGAVKDELYTGLDTASVLVSDLLASPNYPASPGEVLYQTGPEGPVDYLDGYGSRLSGWFTPAQTGNYIFFLCADDNAELYLSTDDTAANLKRIAVETSWSNSREWLTSSGGSDVTAKRSDQYASTQWPDFTTITLNAGVKYYFEALMKEGGGGDNVAFTYAIAGNPLPQDGDGPVLGPEYSALVDPTGASVAITQQPASVTATEGTTVTFHVGATGASPYGTAVAYQWFRNGVQISGARGADYTIPTVSLANDQDARFKCYVALPGVYLFSDEATLTVNEDNEPPKILQVTVNSLGAATVAFDEPLDPTTAVELFNYGITPDVLIDSVTLGSAGTTVRLGATSFAADQIYTLTVGGVKDLFDNAVPEGTQFVFLSTVFGYADVILADGPVVYYRFEETNGQQTANLGTAGTSGTGLWMFGAGPGTSTPTDVSFGDGPRPNTFLGFEPNNLAGRFTGASGQLWVDAQQQFLNNLGAFSLEYWVNPTGGRDDNPTQWPTRVGIVGQNDAIEYGFIDWNTIQIWTPAASAGALDTDYPYPDDEWHHVATIANGTSIRNYFDGKLVGSVSGTLVTSYGSSTYNVHVGGGGAFDADGNFFTGLIDEVAIFNKAIPAERIAAHYAAGKEGGTATPTPPEFTSFVLNADKSITLEWEGAAILEVAPTVLGPWQYSGAPTTSPFTLFPPTESMFFARLRR